MIERAKQEGLTFAQIGAVLGVTRQAVHARFRKARSGHLAVGALASYDDLLEAAASLLT